MLKLVKLEWKKNKIGKYICNALILTAVLLFLIIALGISGELSSESTVELYGKDMLNAAVELFTNMSYIIFTGVMLASFIVSAYEKKTMNLMFLYPIKRQKILLSEIFAVWIFNFAALVLSKTLSYAVLLLTKPITHISSVGIRFGELPFWLNIMISSAAMVSVSLIALFAGLMLKSSKAAIVTSMIIACLTQGNIGSYTMAGNAPFYAVLFILACISVFFTVLHVETKDVL